MPMLRPLDSQPHHESGSSGHVAQSGIPRRLPTKSHARKREEGHIPRPRNAFIIFRTDLVQAGRIPSSIESHSQNLSRIAGSVWRAMQDGEKQLWYEKAEEEKRRHRERYPQYAYHPTDSYSLRRNRRTVRKGRGEGEVKKERRWCVEVAGLVKNGTEGEALERAVSELERKEGKEEKGKEKERKTPAAVDEFTFVDPYLEGSMSTSSERSTLPCPLDDEPINVPGIADLFPPFACKEPSLSTWFLPSPSSIRTRSTQSFHLPSMTQSIPPPPLITPAAKSTPFNSRLATFPGALHVPNKPRTGLAAYKNVLPSKVRTYGASSSIQIPTPAIVPRERNDERSCTLRAAKPSQPTLSTRIDSDSESEEDYIHSDGDSDVVVSVTDSRGLGGDFMRAH